MIDKNTEQTLLAKIAKLERELQCQTEARIKAEAELAPVYQQSVELAESMNLLSAHFEDIITAQTMELAESRDIALSASKTKSEFLANMSHEIRTPLTSIIGFANSLADEHLGPQDTRLATASIIRNSLHLMNIINDILDLSKIEQQNFSLEQHAFNLFELIGEVENQVSAQAMEKELSLNVQYHFPLPTTLISDPTWLKQVLLNLCSNAIKFTHQGTVTIDISYHQQHSKMVMAVTDSGIGISAQQLDKIFEPFTQADATTTRRYGGTGLGLTICNKLAQLMQGQLLITSEPKKGSCFTFEFSIPEVESAQLCHRLPPQLKVLEVAKTAAGLTVPGLRGRILVAEDNRDTQNLVALYIKKTGATAVFAGDGQQAVEKALAEDFDLVLMDMQMPVVNGIEATAILRQIGFQKPIVSFTANVIKDELKKYQAAGCNAHITKPIDRAQFFAVLAKYLPGADTPTNEQLNTNMLDDEEFTNIRASYMRGMGKLVSTLDQAVQQQNWSQLAVLIHTLKGTSGSLAFNALYTLANDIDQQIKTRQFDTISRYMAALKQEIQLAVASTKVNVGSNRIDDNKLGR